MFWKKKEAVPANAGVSPTKAPPDGVEAPATKAEVPKPKAEKLPGPQEVPQVVGRDIVSKLHKEPDWVWYSLKAVVRKNPRGTDVFDVRVFDIKEAASKAKIKDYTSLDEHPELILFEGWFDKKSWEAHIEERKR